MDPTLLWFILVNPLVSAALVHFVLKRTKLATTVSVASAFFGVVAAIGVTLSFFVTLGGHYSGVVQVPWLDFGDVFKVNIGLRVDALTCIMLLVVTGIGALVHWYSTVYMAEDEAKARFFGNLSLFMFSMLGIVLADNLVMMFIFWELVGVSSYLLIGHWFQKDSAANAANKAFLANRIGDFGFMLGILFVWGATGTFSFTELTARIANPVGLTQELLTAGALLIFCGAVGKSAQMPLHVWLPDAMEGPTPVSALIHAATMVAAGVFMLARVAFLLAASAYAQDVIMWVGVVTALVAALMATQQDDIKRVLAYSTLSQLGYMVMAVGVAAPGAAMFHLFTHAFFKALLFLGAGAIIHALHHEQNIWNMGGLKKKMPAVFWTFTIGYLALIGCPFLSGFFSKDAILEAALTKNTVVAGIGIATAFLTAYYMTRLYVVTFFGKGRSESASHAHGVPSGMTIPLCILAIFSVIAGYLGVDHILAHHFHADEHHGASPIPLLALAAFVTGTFAGWAVYRNKVKDPILIPFFKNKFYFDELYAALIAGTQDLLARIGDFFDRWIIDALFVRGLSGLAWGIGFVLRLLQFGNVQGYSILFGVGVLVLLFLAYSR